MPTRSNTWQVFLPLPPRECSSNGGHKTWGKTKAVANYRRDCFLILSAGRNMGRMPPKLTPPVALHWEYRLPTKRISEYAPRDCMNGSDALKGAQDALVDAGLLPDDDYKNISSTATTIRRGRFLVPSVLLTITEEGKRNEQA